MKQQILIVGAGGFGREMFGHIERAIAAGMNWEIKGFIDDQADALRSFSYEKSILCGIDAYTPSEGERLICALGDPVTKKAIVEKLKDKGGRFLTFIHPTAIVGRNVTLGEGCVLCHNSSITCDVEIGNFVTINGYSGCGHDAKVGDYTTLSGFCDVPGGVVIGEGVFIGSGAKIVPRKNVGDWATIGIGSVVIRNVKAGQKVFGVPAKSFN